MTRLAATMLLSACTALGACPVVPPPEADGGGDDAGEADAGPADAGVDDCEEFDPGIWEAPMLEPCWPLPEPLGDLHTVNGEPIYANCYLDPLRDPCCGAAECADTEAEVLFLDVVLVVAAERGYPLSMQLIRVGVDDHGASAAFLVTIDWFEMELTFRVPANEDGTITEDAIRAAMPLWLPTSMPPIEDVWAVARTCDEDVVPYFCNAFGPHIPIKLVGECGNGWLALWDPAVVGSSMSKPDCYPSDLPCCGWTEFP